MATDETIKAQWDFFEQMILPGVPENERYKAKVAFYAGVGSLLRLQQTLARNDNLTEVQVAQHIQDWHKECSDFGLQHMAKINSKTTTH